MYKIFETKGEKQVEEGGEEEGQEEEGGLAGLNISLPGNVTITRVGGPASEGVRQCARSWRDGECALYCSEGP